MSRNLDPSLFGHEENWHRDVGMRLRKEERLQEAFPEMSSEELHLEQKMGERNRRRLEKLESTTERMASKFEEVSKLHHLKFERLAQGLARLDEILHRSNQEAAGKLAHLSGKVNERKLFETKIQDMIDRHNQIVQNFEQRITQLQRVLSEQELQLANYSAALEEARQTMVRMKRA